MSGSLSKKDSKICQNYTTLPLGLLPPQRKHTHKESFTVETFAPSFHDFWSLWTTHNVHKHCPRMQETTSSSPCDKPLVQDLLTADWTPLETEAPASPKPGSPHTQLPIAPRILDVQHSHQGFLATDRTKSEPPGISHTQEGMASPVLIPLPDVMLLEEVTPLLNPLNAWGATWVHLRNIRGEL